MIRVAIVAVVLFLFSSIILGQQTAAKPRIIPEKINDNLYILHGAGGIGSNVGVVLSENGIILIDSMLSRAQDELLLAIRKISTKPITHVISTHSDSDHTGSNEYFAKLGATVILQENAKYSSAFSTLLYKNRLTLRHGEEVIEVFAAESHSFDDSIVYLRNANLVFMGDAYATKWHASFYAGGLKGQTDAVQIAKSVSDEETRFLPGHGNYTKRDSLDKYLKTTEKLVRYIGLQHQAGISAEAISKQPEYRKTLRDYLVFQKDRDIRESRQLRFVQRVTSTDLVKGVSLDASVRREIIGKYRFASGEPVEIVDVAGRLIVRSKGRFMYELVPLGKDEFHIRLLIGRSLKLTRNKADSVVGFDWVGGEERRSADKLSGEPVIFSDSFESYMSGSSPGLPWTRDGGGTVTIDDSRSVSGNKSVKFVSSESYANRAFLRLTGNKYFPVAGNRFFGSMYMYIDTVSPDGIHWTMIQSSGEVPDESFRSEIRYGGQHSKRLMANYETNGVKTDCWNHSKTVLPEKKWIRVEWFFDGNEDQMKFWLNGKPIDDLSVQGSGQGCVGDDLVGQWKFPVFEDITVGWVDYQKGGGTRTLWIDDFVISKQRVR